MVRAAVDLTKRKFVALKIFQCEDWTLRQGSGNIDLTRFSVSRIDGGWMVRAAVDLTKRNVISLKIIHCEGWNIDLTRF